MSRRPTTPSQLAGRAGLEDDDVLIMLWDAGLDYVKGPSSTIRTYDVSRAEFACGLADAAERTRIAYWEHMLGMSPADFRTWAADKAHVKVGPASRKLPKGGLAKIERAVKRDRPAPVAPLLARSRKETPPRASRPDPVAELPWEIVGKPRDNLVLLGEDDIERIHWAIAEDFASTSDPIAPAGVRYPDLLASATLRMETGIVGERKYPTAEMVSAALMHAVVHNHPFYNGNKRTALVAMLSQLDLNGLMLTCQQDELFRWTLRVASHALLPAGQTGDRTDQETLVMARWIAQNSRRIDQGERVITWAELSPRLNALGCEVHPSGSSGGRQIVERDVLVRVRGPFGPRSKKERRTYSFPYGGDGRQVGRGHIKEMRRRLCLSEDDGIDSATFYGTDQRPVDAFIAEYRKTLRRLARM